MALNLRWDAVRTMKAALAGTASTKFLNVFKAAFGEEEDESEVTDFVPTEQEEEEDLPEGAVTTTKKADTDFGEPSTSAEKWKTRSSTKQPPIKKSRKKAAPTKSTGPFTLKDASPVFPDKDNKVSYLHTGVPNIYISQRQSGPWSRVAIYKCNYAWALCEKGQNPQECDVICQSHGQTSTHIRQYHLNICVECFVCGHQWWSAFEWKKHMKSSHTDLSEDDWFVSSESIGSNLTVKKEVTSEQLLQDFGGDDDEDDE